MLPGVFCKALKTLGNVGMIWSNHNPNTLIPLTRYSNQNTPTQRTDLGPYPHPSLSFPKATLTHYIPIPHKYNPSVIREPEPSVLPAVWLENLLAANCWLTGRTCRAAGGWLSGVSPVELPPRLAQWIRASLLCQLLGATDGLGPTLQASVSICNEKSCWNSVLDRVYGFLCGVCVCGCGCACWG